MGKRIVVFEADDGSVFPSEWDFLAFERSGVA